MDARTLRRRSISVPSYFLAWLLLSALLPVVLPVAAAIDAWRGARWARARLIGFFWCYLSFQMVGLANLGWLALRYRSDDARGLAAVYALHRWWSWVVMHVGARLMGFSFEVEGQECVQEGPIIVFLRHTSFVDVLFGQSFAARPGDLRIRYVLKQGLRADPCMDVCLTRMQSYFIDRSGDSADARARVRQLASGLGPGDAVLIYPEGTRFLPETLAKIQRKFKETQPELYPYCAGLTNVLPPRLGGPFALLDGAPDADVVFVTHSGLEGFDTVKSMLSGSVVGKTVRLKMWRVPAAEIPRDFQGRVAWIYEHWARVGELGAELNEV